MTAYYNEFEPYAAQWLRNLIDAGHIARGDVDDRSITEVSPDDLKGYKQAHFFAGIGGWSLALRLAGWPDDRPVWTGSCPCQPFSVAGKQGGADDERHLWPAFFALISERKPATVFGEQVASKDGRAWLSAVRLDLEAAGYACGAADLCAAGVGAPHVRQRLFWVGNSDCHANSRSQRSGAGRANKEDGFWKAAEVEQEGGRREFELESSGFVERVPSYSEALRLLHGIPGRVGQLRAYGNAIVPPLAAQFIGAYMECRP